MGGLREKDGSIMASGDTLCRFTMLDAQPAPTLVAQIYGRNFHRVVGFYDSGGNRAIVFSDIMPRNYSGGGVTVYLHYAMTSATSNTVDWDAAFERIGDQQQDLDTDGFAGAQSVDNTTVPGTAGLVDIVSISFTDGAQMDNIAVGEGFRLKITRDSANDDAAGNAELIFVEIKET